MTKETAMGRKPTGKPRGRPKGSTNKPKTDAATEAPKRGRKSADETKASTAPKGPTKDEPRTMHVSEMTDDQRFAKMLEHSRKLATAEAAVAKATADRKNARNLARAELGGDALHEIKHFEEMQTEEGIAKWKSRIAYQVRVARWAKVPIGTQEDLFGDGEDRRPVEDKAYDDGKTAGLDGKNGTPPDRFNSGVLAQKWMAGWHDGQGVLHKGFKPKQDEKPAEPPKDEKPEDGEKDAEESEPAKSEPTKADDGEKRPDVADDFDPKTRAYWLSKGAHHFRSGHSRTIPANVPVEFHASWETGWDNAKKANDEAARKHGHAA